MNRVARFVILEHQTQSGTHWDVMLEKKSVLKTYSIPPQNKNGEPFECSYRILPDHRKAYLDYEGEVSNNRGCVRRIDSGTYETLSLEEIFLNGSLFIGTLKFGELMTFIIPFVS